MAGGGLTPSSSASGIFFQGGGDDESQGGGGGGFMNSHFTSSYGNSSNPGCGGGPGYHNPAMMSVSTPGASSMLTDANSGGGGGISGGGPHLQRSASINNESYMRLPASPLSFSSSSVADGSTVVQRPPPPHHDPRGGSSATSIPTSRRASETFFQDPGQARKKPRVDSKQDDALQQQILRQWLQRQELLHQQQQGQNPQLQLLLQQQKMRQQQQYLQSLPPLQRIQLQQQQQVQQQQQQLQQQQMQQQQGAPRGYENSVCARRLMQYLYHQRQRPSEGSIGYWRKFVNEYFSPRAKKRWCLSHYDNVGHNTLGVSPQAATDEWQCDLCGSKSGRGFEATFDVLPRLNEIKFASGVIDELLYLSVPSERRFPSGIMVLEYAKAVQESVYEHIRVVREGHLRIIFSQELKILSWEFCTRRHEELLPRRLVAPQVNQLLQVAEKCQSTIDQSGPDGIHQQDLQANSNMVMAAGRQLAKSLESHSLNDLGFSKRYVRCLQISEVVSSMKDMIDFCRDQKVGPIEALKSYPYRMRTGKMQMQEMEQVANAAQGLPPDRNSLNKLMALRNNNNMNGQGSAQAAAFALTNYQTMLMKQNQEQTNGTLQQDSSRNMSPSPSYQGAGSLLGGVSSHMSPQRQMPSSSYNSSPHQQYQQQQPSCSGSNQGNKTLEQQITSNAIDSRFLLQLTNVLFHQVSLGTQPYDEDKEAQAIGTASSFLYAAFNTLPLERIMTVLAYRTELVVVLWNYMKRCHENQKWSSMPNLLAYLPGDAPGWLLPLVVFCPVYKHMLMIVDNEEFYEREKPLSLQDIRLLIIILKQALWQLLWVNPLTQPSTGKSVSNNLSKKNPVGLIQNRVGVVVAELLSQLQDWNNRQQFTSSSDFQADTVNEYFISQAIAEGTRANYILMHAPFLIPFTSRVKIFTTQLATARESHGHGSQAIFARNRFRIRRDHILEDAYNQMSALSEDDLRGSIRVTFVNELGVEEAGIDGGGIFKDFMEKITRAAFDVQYGLFKETVDHMLYPNPGSGMVHDQHLQFFHFLGTLLAKAMFEGILVDIPFATFFLSKLKHKYNYLNDLPSLDPELYKHLIFLKRYKGNIAELELYFVILNNEYGERTEEELLQGGKDMRVTNENVITFIHLVSNHRLNFQIRQQSSHFLRGFQQLIPKECIDMFNEHELQVLISGSADYLDIDDLRQNTNYTGGYNAGHYVIDMFWEVLKSFSTENQKKFLKFVTGCSRGPLLGFKYLEPAFCIQRAAGSASNEAVDRLPTSATCMNLLKLPPYQSKEQLETKLMYAISAEAGFDLS